MSEYLSDCDGVRVQSADSEHIKYWTAYPRHLAAFGYGVCGVHTDDDNPDRYIVSIPNAIARELHQYFNTLFGIPQQWIPVSERLPEVMESVLVQMKDGEMKVAYRAPQLHGKGFIVNWLLGNPNDRVVAWRHLPKPYEVRNE